MHSKTFRRRGLVSLVVVSALALTACGAENGGHDSHGSPASREFNDADVMFAQMMIPHHEQALEMTELAETRADDADVRELAAAIAKAQAPEIATMTGWLERWDQPTSMSDHHMGGEDGMADEKQMAKLADSHGAAFDEQFAELMIAHHEGAVTMAEDEQADGKNPKAKKLAATIVETQSKEIAELEEILKGL